MKKVIVSTLLLSIAAALAAAAVTSTEIINNIVVFGDSYSDTGNKQRLTNGPLWSEDLAVGWNASLYSFAFSGAVCDNTMYPKNSQKDYIPSITDQVEMYYKEKLDLNNEETAIVFWVGLNDIYNIFEKGVNDTEAELKKVVECIGTNVRNIRKVFSSNKFIVLGVPPIEKMPYYANSDEAESREKAANHLNELLTKDVEKMNKHSQHLELDRVDIHKLLDDIVDSPELFGLKNAHDSYWDTCQGLCADDIDSYVWWDKTHLTGGVHRLIANSILKAGSLAPETYLEDSVNVQELINQTTHTKFKSPKYKGAKSTGEINRIIEKLKQEKKEKAKENEAEEMEEMSEKGPQKKSKMIYFGMTCTVVACIGFFLFLKNRRRGSHLAALSGLLKNNKPDRGRFMPLRNMDSEV